MKFSYYHLNLQYMLDMVILYSDEYRNQIYILKTGHWSEDYSGGFRNHLTSFEAESLEEAKKKIEFMFLEYQL